MSNRACLTTLFLVCSCCLAASRQVFAGPGEAGGNRDEFRQKVLQKFDKNGNGQLDPDERAAAKEAMQKRREQGGGQNPGGKNAGGKGPPGQGGPDPERRRKLLERFDTDGDGQLSDAEKAAAKEAKARRGR